MCCPREALVYFQPSFAVSLFHCFTFLFLFIDWWIHLTKYKHPVMIHFMYILFLLIFTSSFIFFFSTYPLFNHHISVFLSWHTSLSFLISIISGYFVLVLIFLFFCLLAFLDIGFPMFRTLGHKFSHSVSLAYHQSISHKHILQIPKYLLGETFFCKSGFLFHQIKNSVWAGLSSHTQTLLDYRELLKPWATTAFSCYFCSSALQCVSLHLLFSFIFLLYYIL